MRELSTRKYKGLGRKESFLLLSLARKDKKIFTIKDAKEISKNPQKILYSLSKKRWILHLKRGLYATVPMDIGPKGADAFIIHDFNIASNLVRPYYIGYWSALNYHGLTDEIPNTVFIASLEAKKPLKILYSRFYFVKLIKRKFFGFRKFKVEGEEVNISNKEKTIADCLDHPEHAGGIDEIGRSIFFNHKELDFSVVENYLMKIDNLTAIKRFGYILEACNLGYKVNTSKISKTFSLLDPLSPKRGTYNKKWFLIINRKINPESWMY